MRYCPISVRLTPVSPTHAPLAFSGCYVETASSTFCVSVLHLPATELSNYRIHVATPHIGDHVEWIRARVVDSFAVFPDANGGSGRVPENLPENSLSSFLDAAIRNGFHFFPMQSVAGGSLGNMTVVKMDAYMQDARVGLSDLTFGPASPLDQLAVQSTPFGLTNPKLFGNFRSTGGVCAVLADGYLSDCRYLENMIGGVVSSQEQGHQVGLVIGNLRKQNGDGDLMVVVAMSALERLFPAEKRNSSPNAAPNPRFNFPKATPPPNYLHRISPLFFSSGKNSSWGTCVVYNEATLVTNYHVVQPLIEDPDVTCRAIFDSRILQISRNQVVVPFAELDLAFIVLDAGTQAFPHSMGFTQLHTSTSAGTSRLSAAGFGLFLNKKRLEPLVSSGLMCRNITLAPFTHSQSPVPCLMITSTACWNGSSGGGVFDSQGGFVGLISSNAQVYVPEPGGQAPTQRTEKVPSFCFTIPAELISLCYDAKVVKSTAVKLSEQVIKAWRLESYYPESFQPEAKM